MGRVQTGCRDCKRCNNSAMAEAGRKFGKLSANVMTMGGVAAVQAFSANCRACGHKKSLHNQPGEALPVAETAPQYAPAPGPIQQPPGWYAVPGGHAYWDGRQWGPITPLR